MTSIVKRLGPLCPPIRLITTSRCNTLCDFCHHEWFNSATDIDMSADMLFAAVTAAKELGFPRITFSGGEPTVLPELPSLIRETRRIYPTCFLGLVTNGFALQSMWTALCGQLDAVDLSITSLTNSVGSNSFHVSPISIPNLFGGIIRGKPAITINCVVTPENMKNLDSWISDARSNNYSLTLMAALPPNRHTRKVTEWIEKIIVKYELTTIKIKSTPFLETNNCSPVVLRAKLPVLSSIVQWKKCSQCAYRSECGEYFCAIRIYPDGTVSSCCRECVPGKADTPTKLRSLILDALTSMTGRIHDWTDLIPWARCQP